MPRRLTVILFIVTGTFTRALTSIQEVVIKPRPFEVSISIQDEFACAGVIITPFWIFTAASCVQGYEKLSLNVRAGSSDAEPDGQLRTITQAFVHPLFQWQTNDYNLAGLKLSKRLKIGKNVRSIRTALSPTLPGQNLKSSGWIYKDDDEVGTFTETTLRVISQDECQLMYADVVKITPRMLCVWTGNLSSEISPSWLNQGQPLINTWKQLVGLFSYNAGSDEYPAIFTNLEKFKWTFQNNSLFFTLVIART